MLPVAGRVNRFPRNPEDDDVERVRILGTSTYDKNLALNLMRPFPREVMRE